MAPPPPGTSRAGPFYTGVLDTQGTGSKALTIAEREALLESERTSPASAVYRPSKPHTAEKLEFIRGYLGAYSVIQNAHYRRRFAYVDALAGPGIVDFRPRLPAGQTALSPDPAPGDLALGSPLLALSNHPHFPVVRLIEQSAGAYAALKSRVDAYYPGRGLLLKGDCNCLLTNVALNVNSLADKGLFLLDPEGLEVRFETIRKIKRFFAGAELLVLYPTFMAVARCIVHRQSFRKLDHFFGDEGDEGVSRWAEIAELGREGMLGDPEETDWDEDPPVGENNPVHERLREHYVSQLRSAGYSSVAVSPVVRSSSGRPLYNMIFAGNNETGAKIIGEIFRSVHGKRAQP